MSVYNKLYDWRSFILKVSFTLLRSISTNSVISPSRLKQVQVKRLHEVKNHLRLQLLYSEIRTMETDASLSSSNLNDSPDVESPKYHDVGTQRDFKSKEDSFFVPKQCFSGSEESDTEISDGKDDKDKVVESVEEEGEAKDGSLKGNEEEETKTLPMDVLPEDADPDKTVNAEEDGAAHSSDKVTDKEVCLVNKQPEKRKLQEESEALNRELKKAKLETKALKAKRPGFTDERYNETSYYIENGLRKVYPYYFTFTTFTKGRWVGEKILDVFAREFRAHPPQEYERCIKSGTLTVNYEKVDIDYKLKHNDLLANVVHRHEVPVSAEPINIIHLDEDIVVVNKPASIPVHPCGRYRHNTVVFILAKEYQLKNLRTIHRLDRLTSGLLLFGRTPKKARQMEQQIRNRMVQKEYVCRVDGQFPSEVVHCSEPIEVVSYKIGVCKVSPKGKECTTTFHKLGYNPETNTSVVLCQPHTGRMHQIRVHLQYLGYPVVNDPLYNHEVFGPERGRGGNIGKTDEQLIRDLISIHNAENWLGMDGDTDPDLFKPSTPIDDELDKVSRECSPEGSPPPAPPPVPSLPPSALPPHKVTVATQTGHETPDLTFDAEKLTTDPHCYECKVRYRDPKPRDLVMYLHAFKYQGPGWSYQTELPEWARVDWVDTGD